MHTTINDVATVLDLPLDSFTRLSGGNNNLLYSFKYKTGEEAILKIYKRDVRNRLEREFTACRFLNQQGTHIAPKALYKDDEEYFGVYSKIAGKHEKWSEITENETIEIIKLLYQLESLDYTLCSDLYIDRADTAYDLSDTLRILSDRLKEFESVKENATVWNAICKFGFDRRANDALTAFQEKLYHINLTEYFKGLTNLDFGINNMLFTETRLYLLDYEYFTVDSKFHTFASFYQHATTLSASKEQKDLLLNSYIEIYKLSKNKVAELLLWIKACELEWLGIVMSTFTPRIIESRRKSNINFDLESFLSKQIAQLEERFQLLLP